MSRLAQQYFTHAISEDSSTAHAALRLHGEGKLLEAFELGREVDVDSLTDAKLKALFIADRLLLHVKLGLPLPACNDPAVRRDPDARCISAYALFSFHFFNDHRQAWRSLLKLLFYAPRSEARGMTLTAIFLIGHMLCIQGLAPLGYPVAAAAFKMARWLRRKWGPTFAFDIVFAAFPYTLFVRAKLAKVGSLLNELTEWGTKDAYYQTLFQISSLYLHAYSGDVAQAELYAQQFHLLHEQGKMLRYEPLSAVMPLLPIALRGYGHIIEAEFRAVVAAHREEAAVNVINSQFYRAAALIALTLGDKPAALEWAKKARFFRKKSASFRSWAAVDKRIETSAKDTAAFDPTDSWWGIKRVSMHTAPRLANVFMQLISVSSNGVLDPQGFIDDMRRILGNHFECTTSLVGPGLGRLNFDCPSIRIGDVHILFEDIPPQRKTQVWAMINAIAPSVMTLEKSVSQSREMLEKLQVAEREAVVSHMVQMVAHDVRRPFTLLKAGLKVLRRSTASPGKIDDVVEKLEHEVGKSLLSVEGMLLDIHELSSGVSLSVESISVCELVKQTLEQIFQFRPDDEVWIETNFAHRKALAVDDRKVLRVFMNIIENAVQAMHGKGLIRIETHDVRRDGRSEMEITIGNSNSYIPANELPKIFDSFYTKGKRNGTGLGLAIAHKIVVAHGGVISCSSSEAHGTEFTFNLPSATVDDWGKHLQMPVNSRAVGAPLALELAQQSGLL